MPENIYLLVCGAAADSMRSALLGFERTPYNLLLYISYDLYTYSEINRE